MRINFAQNGYIRQQFTVGIGYGNDIDKASNLPINEIKQEPDVIQDEGRQPFTGLTGLATNFVNLTVCFWATTESYREGVLQLQSRSMNRVLTKLTTGGYGVPSNIVELQYPATSPTPQPAP